jgi:hypothetical protein
MISKYNTPNKGKCVYLNPKLYAPSNKTSAENKDFDINFIYLIHKIHLNPLASTNECLSLSPNTIIFCSVQLTFWDSIFLTLTATIPKFFTVIPQCSLIRPLHYTEYAALFCPFTLKFWDLHTPCHDGLMT